MKMIKFNPEDWVNDEMTMKQYKNGDIGLFDYRFRLNLKDDNTFDFFWGEYNFPVVQGWKISDRWYAHPFGTSEYQREGPTIQLAAAKVLANII